MSCADWKRFRCQADVIPKKALPVPLDSSSYRDRVNKPAGRVAFLLEHSLSETNCGTKKLKCAASDDVDSESVVLGKMPPVRQATCL
jgi:hypothetical protein